MVPGGLVCLLQAAGAAIGGVMADSAQAAMGQAMADAQARQDYYTSHVGVPAGTTGADPQPLTLPEDRATTGAHSVPGVQGGGR
jgi:hypothetical protein